MGGEGWQSRGRGGARERTCDRGRGHYWGRGEEDVVGEGGGDVVEGRKGEETLWREGGGDVVEGGMLRGKGGGDVVEGGDVVRKGGGDVVEGGDVMGEGEGTL